MEIRGIWRHSLYACSTEADRNKLSRKERPEKWGCDIVIVQRSCSQAQSFVFAKTQIPLQRAASVLQGQPGEAGGELVWQEPHKVWQR